MLQSSRMRRLLQERWLCLNLGRNDSKGQIDTELFGPGHSSTPGVAPSAQRPPHLPAGPPGAGPLISFACSGLNVHWDPAFHNLLELAEACDVPMRWACRTGCATAASRAGSRLSRLRAGPNRPTSGRQCADLLLPASWRRRYRSLTSVGRGRGQPCRFRVRKM